MIIILELQTTMQEDESLGLGLPTARPDLLNILRHSLPYYLSRIKAGEATRDIPVIALTAYAEPEDRAQAAAAGCYDFDTKPIELERLIPKIQALIGRRGGS